MLNELKNRSSKSRERLGQLLREGGELFSVERAARILNMSNEEAAKTLARWRNQGWLARVKRGIYAAVPIEALNTTSAFEDAWVMVPELFEPAYIAGWSAAEYWDLTEQIFRDVCVYTNRPVSQRIQNIHNVSFIVRHRALSKQFGVKPVWKMGRKIFVSDPTKTIVDMLSNPQIGGGIQHVIDCLQRYLKSEHCNTTQLIEYAIKLGNRAVFKRLGYLATLILGSNHPLIAACEAYLSTGNAQLDPTRKANKLITRWRLLVPENLQINKAYE